MPLAGTRCMLYRPSGLQDLVVRLYWIDPEEKLYKEMRMNPNNCNYLITMTHATRYPTGRIYGLYSYRIYMLQYILTRPLNHNFTKLRLLLKYSNFRHDKALVNPSATSSPVGINRMSSSLLATLSRTK